jgi:nucleoid-associated protein YgaU
MTAAPPVGWVRVKSSDPPISLTVRLADGRPDVTAGYGGWAEVARPRRRPLSVWTASPGLRMTLPLLLDGFGAGRSVERQISQLEKLSLPTAADGAPPRIRLVARGSAVPHQDRVWVVDSLTFADGAIMNAAGNRTRQPATLALLEYIADVRVSEKSTVSQKRGQAARAKSKQGAARKRVRAAHGKPKTTRARTLASASSFGAGEDLLSIAARELGDADRWVEIAQLNGLRDPRAIKPGQELRLP